MNNQPRIICYCTPSYEDYASALGATARIFGLHIHGIEIPAMEPYQAVLKKSEIILDQLSKIPDEEGLLYLDADSLFVSPPDWSEFDGVDLGVHVLPNGMQIGGAIFVRNTPNGISLIERWDQLNQHSKIGFMRDEFNLKEILSPYRQPGRPWIMRNLARWAWSPSMIDKFPGIRPIVVQLRASQFHHAHA